MSVMKRHLLFIPESRKRPITESLLYKQIIRFLEQEKIIDKFEIKFLSIQNSKLPPQRFRSGKSWVSSKAIEKMAENIIKYLYGVRGEYDTKVAYVRGSYLEAIRLAVERSGIGIKEIFTEKELTELKKKGWLWMKVGLRMPEAFKIFERRIQEFIKEDDRQLKLF